MYTNKKINITFLMLYVSVSSVTKPTECRSDGDFRRHGYLVRIQK